VKGASDPCFGGPLIIHIPDEPLTVILQMIFMNDYLYRYKFLLSNIYSDFFHILGKVGVRPKW
jgi:hypothetical protein